MITENKIDESFETRDISTAVVTEQNNFFEFFINSSDQWEFFADQHGNIVYSNDVCEKVSGFTREDYYNDKSLFLTLIYEQDRKRMVEFVMHNYQVSTFREEYRVVSKSGELVWIHHFCRAIYNEKKEFIGRRVNCRIINEFKEREQKLIDTQNRLKLTHSIFYELVTERSVENIIRSALYQTNVMFPLLRITYANIDSNGLLQSQFTQNIDDRNEIDSVEFDIEDVETDRQSVLLSGEPFISENVFIDKRFTKLHDKFREIELSSLIAKPLNHSRMTKGLICFDAKEPHAWSSHEIKTLSNLADFLSLSLKLTAVLNRQQRAERKYKEASTRLINLMDSLIGGIIFEDVNAKIVHVNKSLCDLFYLGNCYKKWPNQESAVLLNTISQRFEDPLTFLSMISELSLTRKAIKQSEYNLLDGRTLEIDYIPVYVGNEYNGRLWHFLDITDRVNADAELKKNQVLLVKRTEELIKVNEKLRTSEKELRKSNAEKDRFFSIIAHDLRYPFSPILGFSEMLAEEAENLTPAEIVDYANAIHNSSKSLYKLVENLLQWSRVQSGRMNIEPVLFNLFDMVRDNITVYSGQALAKGVKIVCDLGKHINVYADPNTIETVLRNLISNAVKFTENTGTVIIQASEEDDIVTISVQDTGVGIKKSDIDKLFRIDNQFSTPGTENEKGTGLGLILVKDFVELNKGNIFVESKPGLGTKISFTLPAKSK